MTAPFQMVAGFRERLDPERLEGRWIVRRRNL
jgi:hypothetical protein